MEKKGPNEYVRGKLNLLYTADDDLDCSVVVSITNRTLALNQGQNIAQKMVCFQFYFQFLTLCT